MSKDGQRSSRNTRLLVRGGEADQEAGMLRVETGHREHRSYYDHVLMRYVTNGFLERGAVPRFPQWLRWHPETGPRMRVWGQVLCRGRLRCELFGLRETEGLSQREKFAPDPPRWKTAADSVLSDQVRQHPEQLFDLCKEAAWRTAADLKLRKPVEVSASAARYDVFASLL